MPREVKEQKKKCPGGLGMDRYHGEHHLGKTSDIVCYRCHARLGCSLCLPMMSEIVCRRCKSWGTRTALGTHGPIVNRDTAWTAFQVVMMIKTGGMKVDEATELIEELFESERK